MGDIFTFKKCCFCINLKAGCYLIGSYALLSNTVTVVMQAINQLSFWTEVSLFSFYLLFIISIINIGFNIVLLYAVKKNREDLIGIVLMYRTVIQVLEAVAFGVYSWLGYGFILIPFLIIHLLSLYCILVIRSYLLTMLPRELEPVPPPTPEAPPPSSPPPTPPP